MRVLTLLTLLASFLGACTMANFTPQARFSESAFLLNDCSRWGQVDKAIYHVSAKYAVKFVERHREWGETVSIADIDLVSMKLADDHMTATSEIKLSWFDQNGIMVRNSVVTQKWESAGGKYVLVDEAVRRGDPAVFAQPPPKGS
jgi:hypothetical protein